MENKKYLLQILHDGLDDFFIDLEIPDEFAISEYAFEVDEFLQIEVELDDENSPSEAKILAGDFEQHLYPVQIRIDTDGEVNGIGMVVTHDVVKQLCPNCFSHNFDRWLDQMLYQESLIEIKE